ncbi:hypothetical protein [Halovivax gelatinilyticus]|uniref:hypothetical protein n=1 Tax=Halovivax gelatinilyticus TaxID=2961597 RepID=UPI0020CA807C|nr:hypothetical protein [Halovivax gelatinilyticus]
MTTDDRSSAGLGFALLTVSFGSLVVYMDGDPTAVFFGACVAMLVYFGADLRRIEITRWITIRFGRGDGEDDRTDD